MCVPLYSVMISELMRYRDIIGDLGFSGGIETLAAGRDLDGWSGESRSCACRVWRRRWQQRATEFLESVVQIRWR